MTETISHRLKQIIDKLDIDIYTLFVSSSQSLKLNISRSEVLNMPELIPDENLSDLCPLGTREVVIGEVLI